MEQSREYSSFKNLRQHNNLSGGLNVSLYNFTGADVILMAFRHDFQQFRYGDVILSCLYVPIFLIAFSGNLMVISTIAFQEQSWRAKHVYLLNLAVSDLLVTLICMPCTVGTILYRLWLSGLILCKVAVFLQGVAVATGIFTLTAMSVDRYAFIQNPSHAHRNSARLHAFVLTTFIWFASALFMAPQLYVRTTDTLVMPDLTPMTFCIESWPNDRARQVVGWMLLFVIYVIPVIVVLVCYINVGKMLCFYSMASENSTAGTSTYIFCRKRAVHILILLVGLFIFCWLPYNVMSLMIDQLDMSRLVEFLPFALWLGHAHSAVNPALYWATNRHFREMVAKVYRKSTKCSSDRETARPFRVSV